jgi:hypothetical protein
MDKEAFREAMREIGKQGGLTRAKNLTPAQRKKSAMKAARAAAKAHRKRARERKAVQK